MLLNEMLNIKYPVIQGGMANIATGEFAAAVSNAGGLGLVGAGGMNTKQLEENILKAKSLTCKPFGVNIMLMNPDAKDMCKLVIDMNVPVVTTGAGTPLDYIPKWKEAGIKVMPVTSSVLIAAKMADAGADAIIAEGCESGGHVGEMTTMALIPQMVDSVKAPIIAAGGIYDSRSLAAALCLGACGVQVGTMLLTTKECPIHDNYKNAVLKAKDNQTIVTGRIGGTPVRILKNKMALEYVKQEKAGACKEELEKYTLGSLRRAVFDGDTQTGSLMAGQVSGALKEIKTVEDALKDLCSGVENVLDNTAKKAK